MNKIFNKISVAVILLFGLNNATAQNVQIPKLSEINGDYIIINSKSYEGVTNVSDAKAMQISVCKDDSLLLDGFYMKGSIPFKAGYNENTGRITINAGTKVFDFSDEQGNGTCQFLYGWDDENSKVTERPIVYRYKGNGKWENATTVVLMTGLEGGEMSPYYFSQGSKICLANAKTENISYVGRDEDQQIFEESRPSYVVRDGDEITIFNMLQIDQYGYGCWLTLDCDYNQGTVITPPTIIGESPNINYPYKALAGCEYDEEANVPTKLTFDGTSEEGNIEGTINDKGNIIGLYPTAIWPAALADNSWYIEKNSYYEFVKNVRITMNDEYSGIETVIDDSDKDIDRIEYYNVNGQKLSAPARNDISIKKIFYKDNTVRSEKIYVR